MRSVLENHVDDFLRILSYDKSEWEGFWKRLKKRFSPLLDEYERAVGEDFYEILRSVRRMDLDRFRRYWIDRKRDLKRRTGVLIRSRAEELELGKADFVVFLFFGGGALDHVVVQGKREKVIMVDVFKFWKEGKLEDLPSLIIEIVEKFRRSGGENRGIQPQG